MSAKVSFFYELIILFLLLLIFIKGICMKHNLLVSFNLIDCVQISNIINHN